MSEPKLNHSVYLFAHSHVGKFVGKRHECWDLVDQALRHAGAASSATTGADDDYVWGTPIGTHQVIAGDVLQFRNFVIATRVVTSVTFDDDAGYDETQEKFERGPITRPSSLRTRDRQAYPSSNRTIPRVSECGSVPFNCTALHPSALRHFAA